MSDEIFLTTIYFRYGVYSNNKVKLKKIISEYGLKWNRAKIKMGLSWNEMVNGFKQFQLNDKFENDSNLNGRSGSIGLWESGTDAVKIMTIDKNNDNEHLPVVLVFKGIENGKFYKEFVGVCVELGCEISRIVDHDGTGFEVIFRKRKNIELIEKLDSVEGTKSIMKEMFLTRINTLKRMGYSFSTEFIIGWQRCIDKYGCYTDKMLHDEISKLNNDVDDINDYVSVDTKKFKINKLLH